MDSDVNQRSPITPLAPVPGPSPSSVSSAFGPDVSREVTTPASTGTVIKRRAPIACKRCRRMRSKCVHDKKPPCQSCKDAGIGADFCVFPVRGQPDMDREYRHPRTKADRSLRPPARSTAGPRVAPSVSGKLLSLPQLLEGEDPIQFLPPLPDIINSVTMFTRHYFQLGFIPKHRFMHKLQTDYRSVNPFLLLSIISISARFTPSLIKQYGGGITASETYIARASRLALMLLYEKPSVEICQGFYLLSIAQQGSGMKNESFLNLGIAMRMATLMNLHREETYHTENPTRDWIIDAESARRTLWMLHSQDNLHSGPSSPVSLVTSDITALLPSTEDDFIHGREPKIRAALPDTPPAKENPALTTAKSRSLFASLVQTHYYWGKISRSAVSVDCHDLPWLDNSDYALSSRELAIWEESLPDDHLFSHMLLKGYKVDGLELAYLATTMVIRLCNIVLRKPYMHFMFPSNTPNQRPVFISNMSIELFTNVKLLYEQIDAKFRDRGPHDGVGAQIMAFCIYTCGILSAHLCKTPYICPESSISELGPLMLGRCIQILQETQELWPLASDWLDGLLTFARSSKTRANRMKTMADGRDPIPRPLPLIHSPAGSTETKPHFLDNQILQNRPHNKDLRLEILPLPGNFSEPNSRFTPVNVPPAHGSSSPSFPSPHHQLPTSHHHQHLQPIPSLQHGLPMPRYHNQLPPIPHTAGLATRGPHQGSINILLETLEKNPSHMGSAVHSPASSLPNFATMGDSTPQDDIEYYEEDDGYTKSLISYLSETEAHGWVPPNALYGYVNVSEAMEV